MRMKTTIKAHAKLNLFLKVTGRRPDGYHNIHSVIQPISLFDEIEIDDMPGNRIETISSSDYTLNGLPWVEPLRLESEHNLTTRAARLLAKLAKCNTGLKMLLKKKIPIAAGLGGGSTDAACVLNHLNELWNLGLTTADLFELGASLGCDIPALLTGKTVEVEGKGEIVKRVNVASMNSIWFVLVNPGISVMTSDIYSKFDSGLTQKSLLTNLSDLLLGLEKGCVAQISKGLHNDLERLALRKYPILARIKEKLLELGALGSLMSGSGATVFGITATRCEADKIATGVSDAVGCPLWTEVVSGI